MSNYELKVEVPVLSQTVPLTNLGVFLCVFTWIWCGLSWSLLIPGGLSFIDSHSDIVISATNLYAYR